MDHIPILGRRSRLDRRWVTRATVLPAPAWHQGQNPPDGAECDLSAFRDDVRPSGVILRSLWAKMKNIRHRALRGPGCSMVSYEVVGLGEFVPGAALSISSMALVAAAACPVVGGFSS